jgi:hypothetical protein
MQALQEVTNKTPCTRMNKQTCSPAEYTLIPELGSIKRSGLPAAVIRRLSCGEGNGALLPNIDSVTKYVF